MKDQKWYLAMIWRWALEIIIFLNIQFFYEFFLKQKLNKVKKFLIKKLTDSFYQLIFLDYFFKII